MNVAKRVSVLCFFFFISCHSTSVKHFFSNVLFNFIDFLVQSPPLTPSQFIDKQTLHFLNIDSSQSKWVMALTVVIWYRSNFWSFCFSLGYYSHYILLQEGYSYKVHCRRHVLDHILCFAFFRCNRTIHTQNISLWTFVCCLEKKNCWAAKKNY